MSWIETIIIGIDGLFLHKARSFLTMLGIIFGVAAVVAMLAIGNGAKEETRRQIEAYGADTLYIRARHIRGDTLREARHQGVAGLTRDDSDALKLIADFVERVAPVSLLSEKASRAGINPRSQVVGVTRDYFEMTNMRVRRGRVFSDLDDSRYNRVAVIGESVAGELFRHEDPIGQSIRVSSLRFKVIGVTASAVSDKKSSGAGGGGGGGAGVQIKTRDVSRDVYIPLSVALSSFPRLKKDDDSEEDPRYHRVGEIIVRIGDPTRLKEARRILERIFQRRHRNVEDVEILIPLEILEQSQKTQEIFNLVMALIAGLSLLVGGIGIMNIMVANVSERTREIGIRRAVGATQQDIERQFLWEAILISLSGGILGVGLGFGIASLVSFTLGWETVTTADAVLLAFGVSSIVGLVFGYYPAQIAASLNPIEALRHE